jgi:RNA polymerase sigma-70 factor (ECF subfamily)
MKIPVTNSEDLDDNTLMAGVIAGELDNMGLLYEKYKRPLYAYFFKFTGGDRHASEDLVHTVFYRAIRYKTSFRCEGSFASWLFSIAHNAGIDHNRKKQRIGEYKSEIQATNNLLSEQNDFEKIEEHNTLESAMTQLKPEERELLNLSKIENLKYREIAVILNTSESNIKIKIFRALRKLKDFYLKIENKGYEKERH